jgi:UDP-N-acetylmuramoylalanine--D-glutamate ligase
MKGYCEPFERKKITVLGLGLLGRGVGDVEFLAKCDAQLLVTDKKSEAELAESVAKLKQYPNITFKLGGHDIKDFQNCDMVLKAASVPLDSPEIAAAHAAGVPVVMSTALFAKYATEAGAVTVGITGTRGKSTLAHMIFHALQKAGRKSHLGGNIRGISTFAVLPEIDAGDIAVLELDSWQLQGFGDLKISPHIAVFTNLMPDHMNYYGGDMEAYFADKSQIFRYQRARDFLFVGKAIAGKIQAARPPVAPNVPPAIPEEWKLQILGQHNRDNASLAAAVLRPLGLSEEAIQDGLESFEGVEGRLQLLGHLGTISVYNDNNASTPEATIAALHALKRPLTLIVGGCDKGVTLNELAHAINENADSVALFSGSGTDRLKPLLKRKYQETGSLSEALKMALAATPKGGTVLFSPAFASFGAFKNYYDRNDQFVAAFSALVS